VTFYIWIAFSFSKDNRQNIEKYKPIIFPDLNPILIFREGFALFALTIIFTGYATILSQSPFIFIPIGLVSTILMIYYIYRKMLIVYFLENEIILWKPSLFHSLFIDIKINNIEALIFKSKDEISNTLSEHNTGPWCSININVNNQKKSFNVDLKMYDAQKLKEYFNKHDKPIYIKVHYEKTAKRIN
jgi:hypothetical protein